MYQGVVQDLIDELGRLPGIGPKSAQRIAFHLVEAEPADVQRLAEVLSSVRDRIQFCTRCFNVSEAELCAICADPRRDDSMICVVEDIKDISAIERTREFKGRYHVLGGALDPLGGVGPEDLHLTELVARLSDPDIEELVVATNPNLTGEATSAYLVRTLRDIPVRITRLASGLPVGGDLEYADEVTLGPAFEGRRVLASGAPRTPSTPPLDGGVRIPG